MQIFYTKISVRDLLPNGYYRAFLIHQKNKIIKYIKKMNSYL
ncbi:hypothetical protein HMPREF9129_1539 [Peptoniphilus indolicus ATCC 29427]|uniref:Uncharacterized protein n=1 Tax=Peptoniphilus indolicus ATCC 29427 TaxID=997350 RepID=G4D559_9FIRM|nr:hypothetical protein HMPREF9129_1539 [Peptoniphilus indolicus ATCC 29427]